MKSILGSWFQYFQADVNVSYQGVEFGSDLFSQPDVRPATTANFRGARHTGVGACVVAPEPGIGAVPLAPRNSMRQIVIRAQQGRIDP
jgi:hypothetical protein